MKPILIIQHLASDGPGNFGRWLTARGLSCEIVEVFRGQVVPADIAPFSGLCVLGGPMHAHDPLSHLDRTVTLIQLAMTLAVPVIGHCLGGQLLARAAGGRVVRHSEPELGWHRIERLDNAEADRWFGAQLFATVLQWHYDSFSIPEGAVPIARSEACENQAFTLDGIHLGMQFHVEGDAQKVNDWCDECSADLAEAADFSAVQQAAEMKRGTTRYFQDMERLSWRIYDQWLKGVRAGVKADSEVLMAHGG